MYVLRMLVWGLAMLIVLLGFSCNKVAEKASEAAAEKAIEAASGGEVDVDYSGETMKVTDKETGESAEVTWEAKSMPEGWPASLPQYPGSEIEAVQKVDTPEGQSLIVSLKTVDSPDKVTGFYEEQATAAGFKEMGTFSTPEGGSTMYESEGGAFTVNYSLDEGGTAVTLQLMDKS